MKEKRYPTETATLERRLLSYSAAAAAAALVMAPTADSQIVYTDVNPDVVLQGVFGGADGLLLVDIDGDAADDLQLRHAIQSVTAPSDRPIAAVTEQNTGTAFIGYVGPYFNYPSALNAGDEVGPAAAFVNNDFNVLGSTYGPYGPYGPWAGAGQTDRYLGVQFVAAGGTTHFAWFRLDVAPNSGSITVKDYAYESTPDTAIEAGAMGVAIEPGPDGLPGTHNLSNVYPNPFNPQAQFSLEIAEQQNVSIALFDALGRQVATLHDGALGAGTIHQFQIDGASLPSGVYVVRAIGERFTDVRQVTLTK